MLIERDGSVQFSSIWLKGVTSVDLSKHCIDSLSGPRFGKAELKDTSGDFWRIELDEPCPAYYLCGVASPYVWEHNAHVLAFPDPGAEHEVIVPGLTVTLLGLRFLPVQASWISDPGRYKGDGYFTTCRNLQAAWYLHEQCGLDDKPNTENDYWRRRNARSRRRTPAQRGLFD